MNINSFICRKIRNVETYDPETDIIQSKYPSVEEGKITMSCEGTETTDVDGATIETIYKAHKATFEGNLSTPSLDLLSAQMGSEKEIATDSLPINVPFSHTFKIENNKVVLIEGYEPKDNIFKNVVLAQGRDQFSTRFELGTLDESGTVEEGKYAYDSTTRTITLPEGTTGELFVNFLMSSKEAIKLAKKSDGIPKYQKIIINAYFSDPCDSNKLYSGVIVADRAQIDPSSIEIALQSDTKHGFKYNMTKDYCSEDANLFEVYVYKDAQ